VFDLRDEALLGRKRAESPIPVSPDAPAPAAQDPLDSPENVEIWQRLLDTYTRELDRQEENRHQMAVEEDCYDNIMWSEDDARVLEDRGQKPVVYNVIANTVDWVLGTEKRARSDFKVLPRRKEDAKPAERKSQILKYLSDVNRTPFSRSRAFADAVKVGIGWMEDCIEEDGEGEPIVSRYESWRNMLWDSAGQELDGKDWRYTYRTKWVDLDIMQSLFRNRAGLLERAARDAEPLTHSGEYGDEPMDRAELEMERIGSAARLPNRYQRQRVRVIEGWFRKPLKVQRLSGGPFAGELYDPHSPGHREAVDRGDADIMERVALRMHCALFTVNGLLWIGPSPYRHNRFPFTAVWGNRRGRDGMPYGMIRRLKDINEDINKRVSKALFLLSTNRVIADEGASDDMDELFEEARRPDANIVKKAGKEVRIETEAQLADAHIMLMQQGIAMIQRAGGVTDENQGLRTNATSGIAIERRQDQGAVSTTLYFDNLRLATQEQGEKELSLVEQFTTEQKQFRITNMRGKPEFITVNDGLPENDIVRSKADYIISEGDWRASMRAAAADELLNLLMKLAPASPEVALAILDLVVEQMDVTNREEIVRRLRDITGMRDPDADEPTPEEQARAAAKQQQQQLQQATVQAQLRKLVAEAVKAERLAEKAEADTVRANITSIGGPKRGAIDIVADVMAAPQIAPAADEVLREAGFVGRAEKDGAAAALQAAAAQAQQAPQPDQSAAPGLGPAAQPPQGASNGQA
jgi:hypothetical protein